MQKRIVWTILVLTYLAIFEISIDVSHWFRSTARTMYTNGFTDGFKSGQHYEKRTK